MAEQTITETQFLREDPRFEAIKLDLLEQASRLNSR
jgi:chemotaxis methyl-accepting protein methylase